MKIRAGYDIAFQCPHAVPMVLMLTSHPSRDGNILTDQSMHFSPGAEARDYVDPYGNICTRLVAPPGLLGYAANLLFSTAGCRMRCARQRAGGIVTITLTSTAGSAHQPDSTPKIGCPLV